MFRDLPRYGAYAPAGEWLADIPVGWVWAPARTIFAERKETGFVDEQMLSVTIARGVIPQQDLLATTGKRDSSNLDKSKYKLVEPGDLVYNKMRAWQGAAGGSSHRGIVSPAYIVVTPRSGSTDFFHHVVRTPMFAKEAERWSYGITSDQWTLRPAHFKMIRFPVPPPDEQAAIVKYLAHANARLDKAITAKRRLIALLEEQRQALVTTALSELTAPRERLGFHVDLLTGFPYKSEDFRPASEAGTCRLLRGVNVGVGEIGWSEVVTVDRDIAVLTDTYRVRTGDIVLGMDRPIIAGGVRVAEVTSTSAGSLLVQRVARLRPKSTLDARYLALAISSGAFASYLEPIFTGISVPHLSPKQIRDFRIAVPPLPAQASLVGKVVERTGELLTAASTIEREIALLQEFRTRLVADVVTGRVDVRAVAATLPDAPEAVADLAADFDGQLDGELTAAAEPGDE